MTEDRIATELWLQAHLRRLGAEAIAAYVLRRGDPRGGLVVLKLVGRDGACRVLTQSRDMEGRRVWLGAQKGAPMAETDADAYISRAVARDPDLWVVEVEDRDGRHPFDDPVV
jgi:hypothetical protein